MRDETSGRNEFFQQHKNHDRCDPKHVHHAADEKQRHEHPATANAVSAVPNAKRQRTASISAKAAVLLDELQWRLAMSKTRVLDWRPLVEAGGDQHQSTQNCARDRHARGKPAPSFDRPLSKCRNECKSDPGKKIPAREPRRWSERCML